jgi:histidinol dehydrogenase
MTLQLTSETFPLTVIDYRQGDARQALAALREKLSPRGDIQSEAGRKKTLEIFGEALTPQQVVERICKDVQNRGIAATLEYTRKLDDPNYDPAKMRVSVEEMQSAHAKVDTAYLKTVRQIRANIIEFQQKILHQTVTLERHSQGQVKLQQRYLPLKRVAVHIPGGAAAYPSSLLMTVVPAQVAGVKEVVVVSPPTANGSYNPYILATCHELGIKEVYRLGGAQVIASLAYGVDGIPAVDKIVGPGNLFVALAKKYVYGTVDIDSIAGPSEVVVLADATANPRYLASDLISQAEHSPGSGVLITWCEKIVAAVKTELIDQLNRLERGDLAHSALLEFGALICVKNQDDAIQLANEMASEHLHISTSNPEEILAQIQNAGAIFLGHDTPVAVGDYFAGPSHVLPTGGTARFANGLCTNDFLKRSSVIQYDRAALKAAEPDISRLAEIEGLTAHKLSVTIRLEE